MPPDRCDLPPDDLLAFAGGELGGGRRELVEAALAASPACRDRLASLERTGRLLRDATPVVDNPAGRAALRARLDWEAIRRPLTPRLGGAATVVALPLVLLVALLLNGQSLFWTPLVAVEDWATNPEPTPADATGGTGITGRRGGALLIAPCLVGRPMAATGYTVHPTTGQANGSARACVDPVSWRVVQPAPGRLATGRTTPTANDVRAYYAALHAQRVAQALGGQTRSGCAARTIGNLTACSSGASPSHPRSWAGSLVGQSASH